MRLSLFSCAWRHTFPTGCKSRILFAFFEESVSFGEFMWSIIFSMIIFFMYTSKLSRQIKRKLMKEFLIFRISIFEYFSGAFEPAHEIFFQVTDLSLFHTENFLIDISHIFLSHGFEIFIRDRPEKSLDVTDGERYS